MSSLAAPWRMLLSMGYRLGQGNRHGGWVTKPFAAPDRRASASGGECLYLPMATPAAGILRFLQGQIAPIVVRDNPGFITLAACVLMLRFLLAVSV